MRDGNAIYAVVLAFAGGFSLLGAIKNWDFFFESARARPFVRIFGRNGARTFYAILGTALIVYGILSAAR